jgi:hypothetical protein
MADERRSHTLQGPRAHQRGLPSPRPGEAGALEGPDALLRGCPDHAARARRSRPGAGGAQACRRAAPRAARYLRVDGPGNEPASCCPRRGARPAGGARRAQGAGRRAAGRRRADVEEVAEVVDVVSITVRRDWKFALAWLRRELEPARPDRSFTAGSVGRQMADFKERRLSQVASRRRGALLPGPGGSHRRRAHQGDRGRALGGAPCEAAGVGGARIAAENVGPLPVRCHAGRIAVPDARAGIGFAGRISRADRRRHQLDGIPRAAEVIPGSARPRRVRDQLNRASRPARRDRLKEHGTGASILV